MGIVGCFSWGKRAATAARRYPTPPPPPSLTCTQIQVRAVHMKGGGGSGTHKRLKYERILFGQDKTSVQMFGHINYYMSSTNRHNYTVYPIVTESLPASQ